MVDFKQRRTTKPSWATESESLDFNVVNEPLEKLVKRIIDTLERRTSAQFSELDFLAQKIVAGCYQTYKAIRKLVAKDPKHPAQAHILNRSLLDAIFAIEAFLEDPGKYPKAYALAGYRMMWEEYTREAQEYGNDPNWNGYLSDKAKLLKFAAKTYGLSDDERNSPGENIQYWPIPSKMLRDKIFSDSRHLFLKELYDWHPGKFESDAVYKSILYLLIISEIEAVSNLGVKQDLKYIWTMIGNHWEEAKEFYDKRFTELLSDRQA